MTNKMSSERKTAIIVGILFIIGTVSGIMAAVVAAPIRQSAAFSSGCWCGNRTFIDPNCHSGNGFCGMADR